MGTGGGEALHEGVARSAREFLDGLEEVLARAIADRVGEDAGAGHPEVLTRKQVDGSLAPGQGGDDVPNVPADGAGGFRVAEEGQGRPVVVVRLVYVRGG